MSQSSAISSGHVGPPELRSAPAEPLPAASLSRTSHLTGTRSGWAMRLTYLLGDCASISLALCAVHVAACLVQQLPIAPTALALKLYGLLAGGLIAVALFGRTYAAIP